MSIPIDLARFALWSSWCILVKTFLVASVFAFALLSFPLRVIYRLLWPREMMLYLLFDSFEVYVVHTKYKMVAAISRRISYL